MNHTTEGIVKACCHTVSYWLGGDHEISEALKKEMEEHAEERAKECIVQGYNQGELNYIESTTEHEYTGWWRIDNN